MVFQIFTDFYPGYIFLGENVKKKCEDNIRLEENRGDFDWENRSDVDWWNRRHNAFAAVVAAAEDWVHSEIRGNMLEIGEDSVRMGVGHWFARKLMLNYKIVQDLVFENELKQKG